MYALLPCLVAFLNLFASVVALPPNPIPPSPVYCYAPGDHLCSGSCCSSQFSCAGEECKPIAGSISVSYYTDSHGDEGMIAVHGVNFQSTAGLVVLVGSAGIYDLENIAGPSWTVYTGIQDCAMDGASNAASVGSPATVFANDDFLTSYYDWVTPSNSVAVVAMPGGAMCPQPRHIITPTLILGSVPSFA